MTVHRINAHRRPPRLAEEVADSVRNRILAGEFADGDSLPKQEDLVREYRVSLPSVREALRVLETEGLVTVQRGKIGGSIVHVPRAGKVAYMLGLVLQSRQVEVDDVVHAMAQIEPLCARACALRTDRRRAVVPSLRRVLKASEAVVADPPEFSRLARRFHEELVASCGNQTFIVMVGALESLWTGQVEARGNGARLGEFAVRETRERSVEEHRRLLDCIVAGDADGAERVAREHQGSPKRHGLIGRGVKITADPLREA
jgi:GntR family transcriptional regulator, transcriptional repressor for pyruvate dehydrogenase complex